jgi:hypothetical protein
MAEMDGKDYEFDGETYVHTDKESGVKYRWDLSKNEWCLIDAGTQPGSEGSSSNQTDDPKKDPDPSAAQYTYEGDTAIYTDPTDGTAYEWDAEKNAWIPKVLQFKGKFE